MKATRTSVNRAKYSSDSPGTFYQSIRETERSLKFLDIGGQRYSTPWMDPAYTRDFLCVWCLICRLHSFSFFQLLHDGLQVAYNQSSIFLPPQMFHSSRDSKVVTLVYLTLSDVLSLKKETGGKMFPKTTIVSSTVEPRPLGDLKNPVKIILENRKV